MRGSIVKRGKTYSLVLELDRHPVTGKRRQQWVGGFRTKRDAEKELVERVAAATAGTYVEPTKQTVREFLVDWLAAVEPTIRPATQHSYARNVRLHVLPTLGSVPLRRVDAGALNALYAQLLAGGKRSNGGAGCHLGRSGMCTRSCTGPSVTRSAGGGSSGTRPTLRTRHAPRRPLDRR